MSGWNFQNAAAAAPTEQGPVAGPEVEEITTSSLGFQAIAGETKLKLLPNPWPEDQLPPPTASLLSIASKKGLVAAAGPDSLVIASTEAVRKGYRSDTPPDDNVQPFSPQTTISIPRVSQVAFSSDESCLVITAEAGGGFNVYDVDALLQGSQASAFQMATNNTSIRALLPNPAPEFAHLYAVVLDDGKLMVANLKDRQFTSVFREGVSCVSWSARGKQLVAGLQDGTAAQYDPQGAIKAEIPRPPQMNNIPMTSIYWVSNDDFFTVHTPTSGDDTDSVYHIIQRGKGPRDQSTGQVSVSFTARRLVIDPCPAFGMPRTPAHHFISRLRQFAPSLDEMLIMASTAAVDIGIITKASTSLAYDDMPQEKTVDTFTITGMLDDTRRAQMPMSAGDAMGDTSPIGMAVDLSCKENVVKPIPQEEIDESSTPVPALMVLNNEGLLCTWWIIYDASIRQGTAYPGLVAASSDAAPAAQPTPQQPPSVGATPSTGFGAFASAKPSFGSSGFGKPAAPAFGSPSTPAFGKPAFGSTTSFGNTSGAGGAFGSASAIGNAKSPWGASTSATSGPTFGQASTPFGAASTTSGASGFAALTANAPEKPAFASGDSKPAPKSPFTSFGNDSQSKTSPFGTVAAAGDKNPSPFGSFGQKTTEKADTTPQPSFGSTVTLPSTTGGSFGAASTIGAKPSPWASPAAVESPAAPSKEEDISDDDDDDAGKSSQETARPEESKPAFGQPSEPASQSPFAQFATDKGKPSAFGQPSNTADASKPSPFAQVSKPSIFGQPSGKTADTKSPFAQVGSNQPGTSLFSKPSDKSTTSIFGQPSSKPAQSPFGNKSQSPSGIPKFSGFKLGSTFKKDDSASDDQPASKGSGDGLFGSAFGKTLGEAAKETPKEPETPIRESEADKTKTDAVSTTPASPPKGKDESEPAEPEDAPLPPDFTTFKSKPVEADLPPIAGSPPVDLGDKSQMSSPVSSIGEDDGDERDNEDDEDEDDDDGEDEEESNDEEVDGPLDDDDESWADEDDDDDEDGPDQDDTVSRPPKTAGANAFGSRLTFPSNSVKSTGRSPVPSTTPAGLPKAPIFPPPANKQTSPRSPSPVRPDRSTGMPPPQTSARQPLAKPPVSVAPLKARPQQPSAPAQKAPPASVEPETGDLSDDEDARIQELLHEPIEPTKDLDGFVAHQDYLGHVTKPGIGGQIEKVYRDINSMIDTLGLNVRSLQSFIKGHEELVQTSGRERSDLEDAEDWCLVETDELGVVEKNLGDDLEAGKVHDVKDKVGELIELYKESTKLRVKTADMRKTIAARTDPQQRSSHRAAALNTEAQMRQTELRQGVSKVQKLLQEAEESLSVLRAELASVPSIADGAPTQRAPTVEAVTNTILKMTAMIEQKSGDVDVLEAQIRRLPQGLAGLSLEDEQDMMRSSVRSLNGRGIFSTPPIVRSRAAAKGGAIPLNMSGMFGSSVTTNRFAASTTTPQAMRNSTYGFSYTPEESIDFRSSVRSFGSSQRKKMSDVTSEEVKRYLAKQDQRKKVLGALRATVQKRGTRVSQVEK
ncbi:hypothetical protein AAFC00_005926 [Neodothiora populina]|uniref:Nucleoporin Nup159/Nup146 N-terminal domain-containing protein n=1 Tax=Neodothiora populina TaxID=2781224 RepID=A0ABR3P702_9PEZI